MEQYQILKTLVVLYVSLVTTQRVVYLHVIYVTAGTTALKGRRLYALQEHSLQVVLRIALHALQETSVIPMEPLVYALQELSQMVLQQHVWIVLLARTLLMQDQVSAQCVYQEHMQ